MTPSSHCSYLRMKTQIHFFTLNNIEIDSLITAVFRIAFYSCITSWALSCYFFEILAARPFLAVSAVACQS